MELSLFWWDLWTNTHNFVENTYEFFNNKKMWSLLILLEKKIQQKACGIMTTINSVFEFSKSKHILQNELNYIIDILYHYIYKATKNIWHHDNRKFYTWKEHSKFQPIKTYLKKWIKLYYMHLVPLNISRYIFAFVWEWLKSLRIVFNFWTSQMWFNKVLDILSKGAVYIQV